MMVKHEILIKVVLQLKDTFSIVHTYLHACLNTWSSTMMVLTLVDLELDAQNSYLFTYNTFIKILYMFRALPCSSSGGLRRNCVYAASGLVTFCR
jgi:hypothetical protein